MGKKGIFGMMQREHLGYDDEETRLYMWSEYMCKFNILSCG